MDQNEGKPWLSVSEVRSLATRKEQFLEDAIHFRDATAQRLNKYGVTMNKRVRTKCEKRYAKISALAERCRSTPDELFDDEVMDQIYKAYEQLLDESMRESGPV